jgi:DNA-binding transcriptional regulator LsrR (DeoR family)
MVTFRNSYPDHAQFLQLYFFSGMSMAECAVALQVSHRTAERYWQFSRAWMNRDLTK